MSLHTYTQTYLPVIYICITHPHKLYCLITPHLWGERKLKPHLISVRKINALQYFKRLNWVIYNLKFNRIFPFCFLFPICKVFLLVLHAGLCGLIIHNGTIFTNYLPLQREIFEKAKNTLYIGQYLDQHLTHRKLLNKYSSDQLSK